jgi:vacuolar-type H+-ATPase subunit E/Vma4
MISVEEKVSVFTRYVLNRERNYGKDIVNVAKDERNEMIEENDRLIEEKISSINERTDKKIFQEENRIIAKAKTDAKRTYLKAKNELLDDFLEAIMEKSENILDNEEYLKYLERCFKQIEYNFVNVKEINIFCTKEDAAHCNEFGEKYLSNYNWKVLTSEQGMVGGILVKDSNNRFSLDLSIRNQLKKSMNEIGLILNEIVEE